MPPSNGSCLLSPPGLCGGSPARFLPSKLALSLQTAREQALALGGVGGRQGLGACQKSGRLGVSACERNGPMFHCQSEMSGLFLSGAVPWTTLPHCSSFPLAPLPLLAGSRKGRTVLSAVHTKGLPFPALLARGAWGRGEGWG